MFALAVIDGLTEIGTPPPSTPQQIIEALDRLPKDQQHLKTTLTVLLHDAGPDVEAFKKMLEQWFEGAMERVSGWYKRRTQWILMVFAVGLTIWTNCDTVSLANTLWRDPVIRSSLVSQAQQYVDQQRKEAVATKTAPLTEGPPPPPAEAPADAPDYEDASEKFEKSMKAVRGMGIPLGWGTKDDPNDKREPIPADVSAAIGAVAQHGLGWLLTALAISLGAPFWFDMLNKIVSIRSAGKAPEEKQKAPKQVPVPLEPGGVKSEKTGES